MKSLTREVTTHIRTDAQGGPFNPVFGVKTPHEINEMKEEILWNKHFITIGGKSIFYKAWVSRGIQILNDLLDSHGVLFHFENLKVIEKGAAYSISTLVVSQRFPKIIYCIVMATLDGRPCGNLIFLRLMTPPSVVIRIWFVLQGTLELP